MKDINRESTPKPINNMDGIIKKLESHGKVKVLNKPHHIKAQDRVNEVAIKTGIEYLRIHEIRG